jgi:DNA-binding HxlR family transcriptional regulator
MMLSATTGDAGGTDTVSETLKPLDPDMFSPACPSSTPMRVGDKWTSMIIVCLEDGPRRFSELRVPLRGVTPKVLTESLRSLERHGLVRRTAYDEIPPRVEYELTTLGRSFLGPLTATKAWCEAHVGELLAARENHETHSPLG